MDRSSMRYRIIAFVTALFILPLFWPSGNKGVCDNFGQHTSEAESTLSSPDPGSSPLLKNEPTLPERSPHISAYHSTGKQYLSEFHHYSSGGRQRLPISAVLLFIIIWISFTGITYSQRATIKYIHDQDGHKI